MTSAEAEEAVTELLARSFGQPAASYTDVETGTTTVTVYFHTRPDWSQATRAGLGAGLERIRRCGLERCSRASGAVQGPLGRLGRVLEAAFQTD